MDDEPEKVEVRFTADFNWPVPGTCETLSCKKDWSGMVPKACAEAAIAEGRAASAASMISKSAAKKAKSVVS